MVLVLVLLLTQAVQQTPPPRDAKPSAGSGTAVIAGRVVDAETGAPIGGAMLQIGPVKIGERPTQVEADHRGQFKLTGLAAGDYAIVASPPEFRASHLLHILNNDFASLMTGKMSPSVQLKNGEVLDDLVLRLPRALAIDGMVLNEFGEPMANVEVSAEIVQGLPLGGSRGQATDDRGIFRLFGLSPGTYRVCASPTRDWQGPAPTAGETVQHRYVKTCYPSSPAGGGERLAVSASTATPMLTVVMQRLQGFTITGRAVSESGAKNVHVSIQKVGESGSSTITVDMQEGGRFTVRGVPPGTYTLSASGGLSPTSFNEYVSTEHGRATVTVDASDVAGVEIVTSKGATLVGRVVPVEPLPTGTKLRVQRSMGITMLVGNVGSVGGGTVREDLTFELSGIHGEVLFEASGLPRGWVVTAVRYRGADVTDTSVTVATSTQPDLEVHISPRSGQVVARPVDDEGRPMPGAIALIMPAKGDRFSLQSAFGPSKPQEDGLNVWHVRPGEHLLVAINIADLMQIVRDPARVAALRQTGRLVRVTAGERLNVDVVVRPLPEVR